MGSTCSSPSFLNGEFDEYEFLQFCHKKDVHDMIEIATQHGYNCDIIQYNERSIFRYKTHHQNRISFYTYKYDNDTIEYAVAG